MSEVQLSVEDFLGADGTTRGMGLHLSTYDVPRGATAEFDQQTGLLSIKFQYIDDELAKEQVLDDRISLKCGKHSGKVLEIVIQVAKGNIGEVRVSVSKTLDKVEHALNERMSHSMRFNQRLNYEGVKSVLTRNRSAVVSSTGSEASL